MKKIALYLMLMACLLLPATARDLVATGYGNNVQEARTDASSALNRFIHGEFVSDLSVQQTTAVSENGNDTITENYSRNVSSSSLGSLFSVAYQNEKKLSDGTWMAEAVISESNLDSFLYQMKTLQVSIESLQRSVAKGNNDVLLLLYGYLLEWETYIQVISFMGYGDRLPSLNTPMTTVSVLAQYQNELINEANAIEAERKEATELEKQELMKKLASNLSEQKKIEKARRDSQKAYEEQARKTLNDRISQTQTMLGGKVCTSLKSTSTFDDFISRVGKVVESISIAIEEYDEIVGSTLNDMENNGQALLDTIKNRPYRLAEIGADGNPLPPILAMRAREIDNHIFNLELRKVQSIKDVNASFVPMLKGYMKDLGDLRDRFAEAVFSFSINPDECFVFVEYLPYESAWNIEFNFNAGILDGTAMTVKIGYEDLTGNKPIDINKVESYSYEEYNQYLNDIDFYNALFSDLLLYYSVDLKLAGYMEFVKDDIYSYGVGQMVLNDVSFIFSSLSDDTVFIKQGNALDLTSLLPDPVKLIGAAAGLSAELGLDTVVEPSDSTASTEIKKTVVVTSKELKESKDNPAWVFEEREKSIYMGGKTLEERLADSRTGITVYDMQQLFDMYATRGDMQKIILMLRWYSFSLPFVFNQQAAVDFMNSYNLYDKNSDGYILYRTIRDTWPEDVKKQTQLYEIGYNINEEGPDGGVIIYDVDFDNYMGNADGLKSTECGWRYCQAGLNQQGEYIPTSSSEWEDMEMAYVDSYLEICSCWDWDTYRLFQKAKMRRI